MANKTIPLEDKELVKKRLAMGQTTREAIKGTSIKSPNTANQIAKKEADKIGQIRANYLKLIEKYGAGELKRAKMWAEMTKATKLFGKDAVEHPDWANRAEALKYIDSLAGIVVLKEQEVPPIAIQINFGSPEVKEWAT